MLFDNQFQGNIPELFAALVTAFILVYHRLMQPENI
jgi:hypothetical protein